MNDLISRQLAINAADRADYTGLAVEDVKKVTDEVVKELKQLPSAQMKWVLVSDRLPEPNVIADWMVLVHTVDHTYHIWDVKPWRADNYTWEDEDGRCHDKWEVDMWMMIPKPKMREEEYEDNT